MKLIIVLVVSLFTVTSVAADTRCIKSGDRLTKASNEVFTALKMPKSKGFDGKSYCEKVASLQHVTKNTSCCSGYEIQTPDKRTSCKQFEMGAALPKYAADVKAVGGSSKIYEHPEYFEFVIWQLFLTSKQCK